MHLFIGTLSGEKSILDWTIWLSFNTTTRFKSVIMNLWNLKISTKSKKSSVNNNNKSKYSTVTINKSTHYSKNKHKNYKLNKSTRWKVQRKAIKLSRPLSVTISNLIKEQPILKRSIWPRRSVNIYSVFTHKDPLFAMCTHITSTQIQNQSALSDGICSHSCCCTVLLIKMYCLLRKPREYF